MGLLTTTVGSFPKPLELRRARWKFSEGEIDQGALREAEDRATREVLELQESLGLDLLVDGQMDRGDMLAFFAERLDGVEPGDLVRCFGNRYYRKPRVVDEIRRERPMIVERWKQVQQMAARPVRAILTGPYTLMSWSFDEHYLSREKCCFAFTDAVREEAAALLDAGATEIQIDEPAVGHLELDLVAESLARVTRPLAGKARTWLYLAYGNYTRPAELLDLPVDVVMFEMANSGYRVLDGNWPDLPPGRSVAAGVIDVLSAEIETPEEIERRVSRVLKRVQPDRLWVMPDSGLRTLSADRSRAKLQAMVAAVKQLRRR